MGKKRAIDSLIKELEKILRFRIGPVFKRYGLDLDALLAPLKWKPLVLFIGNYSSGKSTFINEFLGMPVQRTGQAPTDDSFTILTMPESGEAEGEVPGSSVVNDERLPFGILRDFGESLISHLRLKRVNSHRLANLAIIDTPGMLDSVTEKDRGYDYLGVVGELARLADLVILMFDPHKAGTIKETYKAIRSTLPGSTTEDRVLYVLNRIDECENSTDLMRSYGALCWNLSQMTGNKDIPRIYLTYAAEKEGLAPAMNGFCELWVSERDELKAAVRSAPEMQFNHILQEVDRGIRELALEMEALAAFKRGFMRRLKNALRFGVFVTLLMFCFGDLLMKVIIGYPELTLLGGIFSNTLVVDLFFWPTLGALLVMTVTFLYIQQLMFPGFVKRALKNLDSLVPLETPYKRDLWQRVRAQVHERISENANWVLWVAHTRHRKKIERFLEKDLRRFFERKQPD